MNIKKSVFQNYKVSGNSVERVQRRCAEKLFSSIFHFGKNSMLKKKKILQSRFRGVALTNFLSSIFHFGQKGRNSKKNFLWICAYTHYVLYDYNISGNSVEWFQRSCADERNRTDGRTGQRHYTLRNSLHGGIITGMQYCKTFPRIY